MTDDILNLMKERCIQKNIKPNTLKFPDKYKENVENRRINGTEKMQRNRRATKET